MNGWMLVNFLPDISNPGSVSFEKKTLGPFSKEVRYIGGRGELTQYTRIDALARLLLGPENRLELG